jgi:hypothetical protein
MSASGCGTTGGTTRETVALAETPAAGALVPIQVDTVTIAPEGAELYAIGASTNMEVAVLAAVDWCAARNDGTAIYRDVFYAAYSKMLLATLGSGKAAVNRAIVRRVAESSLLLAAGVPADGSLPRKLEGTYETLEEAAATLPSHMASAGTAVPFGSTLLFLPSTGSADIPWWKAESPAATPCQSLLGQEGA